MDGNFRVKGVIVTGNYEGVPDPRKKNKVVFDKKYDGCQTLTIKSLPDMVALDDVIEKVEELVKSGSLPQIIDSISASTEFQPNHIFILKKGSDVEYVKSVIYSKTNMQKTQCIKFLAMNGTELIRFSYTSYIKAWLDFRRETKFRIYCNKLQKVRTEYHEKEAYIKALESGKIEEIINKIRKKNSESDNELMEYLIKTLSITDLQATYIMNAGLKTLSPSYLNKYKERAKVLMNLDNEYLNKIIDDSSIDAEIKCELLACKTKYGFPRRCKIVSADFENNIPDGIFKIVVTENGFIKKLLLTDEANTIKGDRAKLILEGSNKENIILCNEQGRTFKLPIHKIPLSDKKSVGYDLRIMLKNNTSKIVQMFYEPTLINIAKYKIKHFVVILTEGNSIKKIDIEDILTALPSGVIYTKLKDNDKVIDIKIVPDSLDVVIFSDKKALRFNMSEVPHYRKNALGVNAMDSENLLEGMSVIYPDMKNIVVITNNGKFNKFDVCALPLLSRYRKGSRIVNLDSTDSIKSICGVNETSKIKLVLSSNGVVTIDPNQIPNGSTISKGIRIPEVPKGNIIIRTEVVR